MNVNNVLKNHGIGDNQSNIKSIQHGTGLWGSDIIKTVTINEVNVNNSIVIVDTTPRGILTDSNLTPDKITVIGTFVDSNNIKIERKTATPSYRPITFIWTIIEFNNVKSKQSGIQRYAGWNETDGITISPINLNKSLLFFHSRTDDTSTTRPCDFKVTAFLDKNNHIQVYPYGENYLHWQVIEFK